MSTAPRFIPHYTIADYQQWDGDWELIDGVPVAMTPSPFGPHERVISRLSGILAEQLRKNAGCDCEIYTNLDWIISDDTVIRPDLMIVCGEQPMKHLERAPSLMVEVLSDSTRNSDLSAKQQLAQQQNVGSYFAIDPNERTIQLSGGNTWKPVAIDEPCEVRLHDRCEVRFPPGDLFD